MIERDFSEPLDVLVDRYLTRVRRDPRLRMESRRLASEATRFEVNAEKSAPRWRSSRASWPR
jgi:hypothetical protein